MSDEKICGRCYLPIHRSDATVYLGDRTSHISARCVALLLAELAARDEQIEGLATRIDIYRAALQDLSCLGNGGRPGNSIGNEIAQRALTRGSDVADAVRRGERMTDPRDEQIAELNAERDTARQECAAFEHALTVACDERDAAREGINAVLDLINNSTGVTGFHMNGEIATWDDLRSGGEYEDWLAPFDAALVDGKINHDDTRGSEITALSFAFGKACALLDAGEDPRKYELPTLLEEWQAALGGGE